jgi:intracellular sulfur oxidation DsrE/DsrF family protein
MKRVLFVAGIAVLSVGFASRQAQHPYRVAFDLTSRDSLDQKAVVRWIREVTTASPKAQIEVVMYGKGFELVMPTKSTVIKDVEAALKNPNVSFKVCEIAMKNNQLDKSMFVAGTQTVPDGIRELTEKQQDKWGYIKASVSH